LGNSENLSEFESAAVIRALGKRVVGDILEIGRRLAECEKQLKEEIPYEFRVERPSTSRADSAKNWVFKAAKDTFEKSCDWLWRARKNYESYLWAETQARGYPDSLGRRDGPAR
jgi:hypothetical protein